jgi:hypothetical protein
MYDVFEITDGIQSLEETPDNCWYVGSEHAGNHNSSSRTEHRHKARIANPEENVSYLQ